MFDEVILFGPTEKGIVVQTRNGTSVKNVIEPEPGFQQRRCYELLLKKHGSRWVQRKAACGVYNCAGLVWASRRTAIVDAEAWTTILKEDGYRKIESPEAPAVGDLVLYREALNDAMLHVATILEMRKGVSLESPPMPWVLSKWDSKSGETMHLATDVPFACQGIEYRITYWTDRNHEGNP